MLQRTVKESHMCYIIANTNYNYHDYQMLEGVERDIQQLQKCLLQLEFKKINIYKNQNYEQCEKIFEQIYEDIIDERYVNLKKPIVYIILIGQGVQKDQISFASADYMESQDYFIDVKYQLKWVEKLKNCVIVCLCDLMKEFQYSKLIKNNKQTSETKASTKNDESSSLSFIIGNRSQDGKQSSIQSFIEQIKTIDVPTNFHLFMFENLRRTANFNLSVAGSEDYTFCNKYTLQQTVLKKCCRADYDDIKNFYRICKPYFSNDKCDKQKFEIYDKGFHGRNFYYGKETYYGWKLCGDRLSLCEGCYNKLDTKWKNFFGYPDSDLL